MYLSQNIIHMNAEFNMIDLLPISVGFTVQHNNDGFHRVYPQKNAFCMDYAFIDLCLVLEVSHHSI